MVSCISDIRLRMAPDAPINGRKKLDLEPDWTSGEFATTMRCLYSGRCIKQALSPIFKMYIRNAELDNCVKRTTRTTFRLGDASQLVMRSSG